MQVVYTIILYSILCFYHRDIYQRKCRVYVNIYIILVFLFLPLILDFFNIFYFYIFGFTISHLNAFATNSCAHPTDDEPEVIYQHPCYVNDNNNNLYMSAFFLIFFLLRFYLFPIRIFCIWCIIIITIIIYEIIF